MRRVQARAAAGLKTSTDLEQSGQQSASAGVLPDSRDKGGRGRRGDSSKAHLPYKYLSVAAVYIKEANKHSPYRAPGDCRLLLSFFPHSPASAQCCR
ncbi:hypothetical protein STEG23_019424 [Scotinomys teguina]